jgi:hypothetical protein
MPLRLNTPPFGFLIPLSALFALIAASIAGCDTTASSGTESSSGDGGGDGDGAAGDGDSPPDYGGAAGNGGADAPGGDGDISVPPKPLPASPPPGYPAGPYGEGNPEEGEVIENLTFFGFPRSGDGVIVGSGEPASFDLASLRDQGASYALIHTATMWCPSCRTAADDLSARGDELSNLGALIIELVLESPSSVDPTPMELSSWALGSDLTVTTVGPGDDRTLLVFPDREYVYIVEMQTMEVVWALEAAFSDPSVTESGIDALLGFLAE